MGFELILRSWDKHNSFHLLILESLTEESLNDYSASQGRNVGEQFSHIVETRLNWLMEMDSTLAIETKTPIKISLNSLAKDLRESSELVKVTLLKGLQTGKLHGYRSDPLRFYSYMISHESHHRGQILLSLKQSGHPASPQISYGIWNWED